MGERRTFFIPLIGFEIEFEVKVDESIEQTNVFSLPDIPEFAFVVAAIWLRTGKGRYLVSSEVETDNLVEGLRDLTTAVQQPEMISGVEAIFVKGGLSDWMRSYWKHIDAESATPSEEATYDLLAPLCIFAERNGCIAVYRYGGVPVIEVAAQRELSETPIADFCEFNESELSRDIAQLQSSVTHLIKSSMRRN